MKSKKPKNGRVVVVVACGVILIGLACMIAGIVLMVKYSNIQKAERSTEKDHYTSEARKSGLNRLLEKLQRTHYELYPDRISEKPLVSAYEIRMKYRSMNLSPENLKKTADSCRQLLADFEELRLTRKKLSIREKRALAVAKFWIKHIMPYGVPFGYDYYVGDWMLSPDVFAWMPICSFGINFQRSINTLKPSNVEDMEIVRERLLGVNRTFSQYVENVKIGVEAGMVRNIDGCRAGLDGVKGNFLDIALHGEKGILNSTTILPKGFYDSFLSNLQNKPDELEAWRKKYGKSVNESLKEYMVTYVGKPINDMLRYLEYDHMQYCPPGDIVAGYRDLPVSFVYKNGTAIRPTTKRLPTGEQLVGVKSFKKILNYFTTTDISPETLNKLGHEFIKEFYDKIIQTARDVTGENESTTAVEKFKKLLQQDKMYFSEQAIPESESNENAHKLCSTVEGAKKHCPVRWKALQNWFTYSRQIIAALDAKIIDLFHFAGPKHTTPNCPVGLSPSFNPSSAAQAYTQTDDLCSKAATYDIPFFLKKLGPKYEEWTLCAHETRPGHHLQAQGYKERFSAADEGIIKWLSDQTYFLNFQEGWAFYAENPLVAVDTDAYKDKPLRKYGMLKWQVMQAIRLIADSGFHSIGNLTRQQVLELKSKYLWDNSDISNKEITRYQSLPGQATTYLVGKLQIMRLRKRAEQKLGKQFNIKDFHFQILHHGPTPFSFLEEMIERFIQCTLDSQLEGCKEVLNPPKLNRIKTVPNHAYETLLEQKKWSLR